MTPFDVSAHIKSRNACELPSNAVLSAIEEESSSETESSTSDLWTCNKSSDIYSDDETEDEELISERACHSSLTRRNSPFRLVSNDYSGSFSCPNRPLRLENQEKRLSPCQSHLIWY